MWYVLKNIDTGRYVAPPGRSHSYTQSLRAARKFRDLGTATANVCGNEVAIELDSEIERHGRPE